MSVLAKDVLIVDDNVILREVIGDIFRQSGWRVRTAADGFSALSMIHKCVPHLLLSDLNMPTMSGFELLAVVRRRFPQTAVIAMSGAFSGGAIPEGVAADAFYAKGECSAPTLLQLATDLLARSDLEDSRPQVPVWVPVQITRSGAHDTLFVACTNCLRVISFLFGTIRPITLSCPHCSFTMYVTLYWDDSSPSTRSTTYDLAGVLTNFMHA